MIAWKQTYLTRLGFGLFVAILMNLTGILNSTFEGGTIILLVTIVLYIADPKASKEKDMTDFWGWLLADSLKFNLSGVGSIQLTTHLARKHYEWLQSSTGKET